MNWQENCETVKYVWQLIISLREVKICVDFAFKYFRINLIPNVLNFYLMLWIYNLSESGVHYGIWKNIFRKWSQVTHKINGAFEFVLLYLGNETG